jgi:hypothetical protein
MCWSKGVTLERIQTVLVDLLQMDNFFKITCKTKIKVTRLRVVIKIKRRGFWDWKKDSFLRPKRIIT